MSRRARLLAFALLATFAIGAAACSDITSPDGSSCEQAKGWQGSGTCMQAGWQGSGT
jgi:opacity protein-like surface antigen